MIVWILDLLATFSMLWVHAAVTHTRLATHQSLVEKLIVAEQRKRLHAVILRLDSRPSSYLCTL